ncbi:hypothetical protein [Natrialba magadii]|nr:hypothetical protein [Natrialba magadii]
MATKKQCNFSHKDDEVVDEAVRALIEYEIGETPSEWIRRKKREELLARDELPLVLAERLASELESEASSALDEAESLRKRADELETEAEDKRQRAEELLDLGDEEVSLESEDDSPKQSYRDRMVEQLADLAADGDALTLRNDDIVREIREASDDPRTSETITPTEWYDELRHEIEQAADVPATELDIAIDQTERLR